ncbi:MAG: SpoVA/SpoVAEb family sporulation membrane protein [Gordonibacter pamelaeae]|uniref:SpoVA/SpoVAEb family sporulation membrane protein n=1 Tax=Gordonibacter massiliensis (ex Traore et al. 2017) TaxID=1841863 RepID=UPI001C8B3817|nr:SpoVA/SpoVAEb family sporulation membrane protein [Gordonibacter massiliensis (ex Traore et al. 2017)]MBX9034460.1 SpoVA/SpoVAEb family sporulation membrane protein [Gordonibacter massiliensis (ex Traore et al. 2017)]
MEGIVAAFFIGGAFCATFQVIQNYTGSIPPKILLVGIGAGALAAALGIMGALGGFAGAGTGILVIGFGEAVYMAVRGMLAGDWTGILTNLVVLIVFCCMGVVAGAGHLARVKGRSAVRRRMSDADAAVE